MKRDLTRTADRAEREPLRREIDAAGKGRWMQEPEIVVRERVTFVEPLPEREWRSERPGRR